MLGRDRPRASRVEPTQRLAPLEPSQTVAPMEVAPMARNRPALRCAALRTNGETCGNYAMVGAMVCHAHGGRAPQVRRAARQRVAMASAVKMLAAWDRRRTAQAAALDPWASAIRVERIVAPLVPAESARELRAIAREMTAAARLLRVEARALLVGRGEDQWLSTR